MSLKIVFCLFLVFVLGASAKRTRIVGGQDADIKEFPFQVSLRLNGQHFCGGSIIDERHIITAAHCVAGIMVAPYRNVRVHTGSSSSTFARGPSYQITRAVIHPNYKDSAEDAYHNDIAVLTLAEPIQFNENQKKISLPTKDVSGGERAIVSGWGLLKYAENERTPSQLQKASMVIVERNRCQSALGSQLHREQVCAVQKKGVGACSGDSGGPLTVDGELVGVASFVVPCGQGLPDVYTRVYSYLDFIQANIKN